MIDLSLLIGRNEENDMGFMRWLEGIFYPGAAYEAKEYERKMDSIDNGIENLMRNNEALSEKNKTLTKQLEASNADCETISNLQAHCQKLNREKAVLMEKAKRLQVEVRTLRQKLYEFIKLADRIKVTSFSIAEFLKQVPTVCDIKTWDVSHEELDEEEFDNNFSDETEEHLREIRKINDALARRRNSDMDPMDDKCSYDGKSFKEVNLEMMNNIETNPQKDEK